MAKGILKGSQNEDSLELSSGLQLPTQSLSRQDVLENGNNTTSRINTLGLENKVNRRVSFAPDVTLHSFDFVPEVKDVKDVKLPRRKEKRDEEDGEESMELSQSGMVTGSEMTMTEVLRPSQEMEMTEVFKPLQSEPMELTQVQRVEKDGYEQMELTEVPQVPQAPEASMRVHAPPPVTPPPAKRTKGISATERADGWEKEEQEDDMELSLMRMSPITLHGSEREQRLSYSLKEFLDAVGVSFLIDAMFVKDQKSVDFQTKILPIPMRADQILSRLYVDMPVLEMNAFVCKELWRRVDQSSVQFQDLENQISSSVPPLLFREYFQSSDDMRRLMNQQLQLVKSFAKLESKKAWYDWRIQHLKGLQDVLLDNLGLLQEEKAKLDKDLQRAERNKQETLSLLQLIKNEVELVRDLPSQVYKKESKLADKLQLEKMRQKLRAQKIALNDSRDLQSKRKSLTEEIEARGKELSKLNEKLGQLQHNNKMFFTEYNFKKLQKKLEMLGSISGVQFKGLYDSKLVVKCFDMIELSIDLSLLQNSPRNAFQVQNDEDLFHRELLRYLLTHVQIGADFLTDLIMHIRVTTPLIKSYRFLKYIFPLKILDIDGKTTVQLMDYDIKTNVKYLYNLSMQELISAIFDEKSLMAISVVLTQRESDKEISPDVISTRFVSKTAKIFPWANRKRISVQITTI